MVDLSNASGLPMLAAMYVAGEHNKRGKPLNSISGRDFVGGLNGKNLLAGGFGASSAQYLGDQVNGRMGVNMSSEMAQAVAGAGISVAGRTMDVDEWTDPIAAGTMYNVARQAFGAANLDLGSLASSAGVGGDAGAPTASTQSAPTQRTLTRSNGGGSSSRRF